MPLSDKLLASQERADSWLCVGLDTDPQRIPLSLRDRRDAVVAFNRAIIESTSDLVCAFKPNLSFYLAQGSAGVDALFETCSLVPRDIPVILDAKFGDIDSSARGYARFAFERLGADAVTVSPFLGSDSLAPFLDYSDRAVFVLCHTSNPGASDLQDVNLQRGNTAQLPSPVYVRVAQLAADLHGKGQVGLVVGATFPQQLREARMVNPSAVMLIPGVGTQGGSLESAVEYGVTNSGVGPVINASRSILYASGDQNYAEAARLAARKMRDEINARRERR